VIREFDFDFEAEVSAVVDQVPFCKEVYSSERVDSTVIYSEAELRRRLERARLTVAKGRGRLLVNLSGESVVAHLFVQRERHSDNAWTSATIDSVGTAAKLPGKEATKFLRSLIGVAEGKGALELTSYVTLEAAGQAAFNESGYRKFGMLRAWNKILSNNSSSCVTEL